MSLETRGYPARPDERDALTALVWTAMNRALRKQVSIQLIHGNSWSGWLENGNPYGDHRPGPIAVPRGILARAGDPKLDA